MPVTARSSRFLIRFYYQGEAYHHYEEAVGREEALERFCERIEAEEWMDFHQPGGRLLRIRSAFLSGMEVL